MKKKVYKLKSNCEKFKVPANASSNSFYNLQMSVNRRRVQKALDARKKLRKKYKKPNSFVLILKLLAFYYGLIGVIILLSRLGF